MTSPTLGPFIALCDVLRCIAGLTHCKLLAFRKIIVELIVVALIVRALVRFSAQSPEDHRGGKVYGCFLVGIVSLYRLCSLIESL